MHSSIQCYSLWQQRNGEVTFCTWLNNYFILPWTVVKKIFRFTLMEVMIFLCNWDGTSLFGAHDGVSFTLLFIEFFMWETFISFNQDNMFLANSVVDMSFNFHTITEKALEITTGGLIFSIHRSSFMLLVQLLREINYYTKLHRYVYIHG